MPLFTSLSGDMELWNTSFIVSDHNHKIEGQHLTGMTWFSRDKPITETLCLMAATARPARPLKVAFVGSSIGCAPYSFILEAASHGLFEEGRIAPVDALDRSDRFNMIARAGKYPRTALRQIPERLSRRYTKDSREPGMFELADEIRGKLNVLPSQWLEDWQPAQSYDTIVAQNVLYYIKDQTAIAQACETVFGSARCMVIFNIYGDDHEDAVADAMDRHSFEYVNWRMNPIVVEPHSVETRIALRQ